MPALTGLRVRLVVALAALGTVLAASSRAQGPGQFTWYALDTAPPGTPPTITLIETASDLQKSVLDVQVHGFWYETITEQGQPFYRLSFDKLRDEAAYRVVGGPELPAIVHAVGALVGVQPQPEPPLPVILDEVAIPGALIYPAQPPQLDHEGDPIPPFQWDQTFYQQTSTAFPPDTAQARGYLGRYNGLDVVVAESYPFRYLPAQQVLLVAKHYQLTIPHSGMEVPQAISITRRQGSLYRHYVQNWTILAPYRPMDFATYRGYYLIVTDPDFEDEIESLAEQKRERGYHVTVATTDDTGGNCVFIRNYILDWWNLDPTADHYVLLAGDDGHIPMCLDENGQPSDRLYGCIDGTGADGFPDPLPEARVGRLSVNSGAVLSLVASRILSYERGFDPDDTWLNEVLLTAHKEELPGLYKLCQLVVAGHSYETQPVFVELYGGDDARDWQVEAEIEDGKSIVCYRGHGNSLAWSGWNLANESWDADDLSHVSGVKRPVVFSIACRNNAVDADPLLPTSIGERWMQNPGAAAHYGASRDSWTEANHVLDLEIFRGLYDRDQVIIGDCLHAAESAMMTELPNCGEINAWIYLLLGDPEMEVWRQAPPPVVASGDFDVSTGPGSVFVRVQNNSSAASPPIDRWGGIGLETAAVLDTSPVPFATVVLHKSGEVQESYYTDANGEVTIPINPTTPGPMILTAYTELEPSGVYVDTIMVVEPTDVSSGGLPGGVVLLPPEPNPSAGRSLLRFSIPQAGPVRLVVYDVAGREVRRLESRNLDAGRHTAEWDGKDRAGREVAPGLYLARLDFGTEARSVRIVRIP